MTVTTREPFRATRGNHGAQKLVTINDVPLVPILKLSLLRGTADRSGACSVVLENADGSRQWEETGLRVHAGQLELKIHTPFARIATVARLYFLDELGQQTDEALVLNLEAAAEPLTKPAALSRCLRALGFCRGEPLAEDVDLSKDEQAALDLDLGLARFQRSIGLPVAKLAGSGSELQDCETLQKLGKAYLSYVYRAVDLPPLRFTPLPEPELTALLRLRVFRGPRARDAYCRIVVQDANGTALWKAYELNIESGDLELRIPTTVAERAVQAQLYFQTRDRQELGEGMVLSLLGEAADLTKPAALGRCLRALGYFPREALAEDVDLGTDEQAALDLDLGLARFQRSVGLRVSQLVRSATAFEVCETLARLEQRYLGYSYEPAALPALEFEPLPETELTVVLRLRVFRGPGAREAHCRMVVQDANGRLLWKAYDLSTEGGDLEVRIPAYVAGRAAQAQLYFQTPDGQELGEGMALSVLEAAEDLTKPAALSRCLRALGYFPREALAEDVDLGTDEQAALDLDLGLARFQRSVGLGVSQLVRSATAFEVCETLVRLEQRYLEYSYEPAVLPALEFGPLPETELTTVLGLRVFRGPEARDLHCRMVVQDANGTSLWKAYDLSTEGGGLEVRIPAYVAERAAQAKVYFQTPDGQELGEGMALSVLEAAEDLTKPAALSRCLRALGFFPREALAEDVDLSKDEQAALDLDLGLARFQRSVGLGVSQLVRSATAFEACATLSSLQQRYLEYSYEPAALPALEFEPLPETELTAVLSLRVFRGPRARDAHCRIVVQDANGTSLWKAYDLSTEDGDLEVRIPANVAERAVQAKVYFQTPDGQELGEGMVLSLLEVAEDLTKPAALSRCLRALGWIPREALAEDVDLGTDEQAALDLDLGLARFQRSVGLGVRQLVRSTTAFEACETLTQLQQIYLDYRYAAVRIQP